MSEDYKSNHNAKDKIVGFEYQYYVALDYLLKVNQWDKCLIEEHGDVTFLDKDEKQILNIEVKHHINENELRVHSEEFQKTIYNWFKDRKKYVEKTKLILLTTSKIEDNNSLFWWNSFSKDKKYQIVNNRKFQNYKFIKKYFKEIKEGNFDNLKSLFEKIHIIDSYPKYPEIIELIKTRNALKVFQDRKDEQEEVLNKVIDNLHRLITKNLEIKGEWEITYDEFIDILRDETKYIRGIHDFSFQQILQNTYKNKECRYIGLDILEKEKQKEKKGKEHQIISLTSPIDIFKYSSKSLIYGKAGIGKTTFCEYLSCQWEKNKILKDKFDYVISLSLRKWKSDSLKGLIKDNFYNKDEDKILLVLKGNNQKILFLFDGYDELLDEKKDLFRDEIKNNNLMNYIITSRPNGYKKEDFKDIKIYEIKGFSDSGISSFIDDFFNNEDKQKKLKDFLFKNSNIHNICRVPLLLKMVCTLWQKENNLNTNITTTEIYSKIIDNILITHKDKSVYFRENRTRIKNILGKLSFEALKNRKIIFSGDLIEEIFTYDEIVFFRKSVFPAGFIKTIREEKDVLDNDLEFSHLTFQEYLTAFFISQNQEEINFETLKKIFAHKYRFYEEFEEIIIYLTNINPKYFDDIVEFDPFIFREHPNLNKEQQEKLLKSMIEKLCNEGKILDYKYLTLITKNTSLSNLSLLNIEEKKQIVKNNIQDYKTINKSLYIYLLSMNLSYDFYSNFWHNIKQNKDFRDIVLYLFIEHKQYNLNLFKFMKDNNLLKKETYKQRFNYNKSFEYKLFIFLYKQKESFKNIMCLLNYIQDDEFENIVSLLKDEDIVVWFDELKNNFSKYKNNLDYIKWCINFYLCSNISFEQSIKNVIELIKKNSLTDDKKFFFKYFFYFQNRCNLMLLIKTLWKLFFEENISDDILKLFTKSLPIKQEHIEGLPKIYSISEYKNKYYRLLQNDLFDPPAKESFNFLLDYPEFEKKKIEEEKEQSKTDEIVLKKPDYKIRSTTEFDFCSQKIIENSRKYIDKKSINEILGSYYKFYLDELKDKFNKLQIIEKYIDKSKDKLFGSKYELKLKIKNKFKYDVIFLLEEKELLSIIDSEDNFKKVFWIWLEQNQYISSFFQNLTISNILIDKYYETFVLESIEAFELSLNKIHNLSVLQVLKEKIKQFDDKKKKIFFDYIQNLSINTFRKLDSDDLTFLLNILGVDKNNFEFIFNLIKKDKKHTDIYLKVLFSMDLNKAIEEYFKYYNENKKSKELYEYLLSSFQKKDSIRILGYEYIENIEQKYIKELIIDFYEKYQKNIYNFYFSMNYSYEKFDTGLWYFLRDKDILEELAKHKNKEISNIARYKLSEMYENNRNVDNKHYKEILDNNKLPISSSADLFEVVYEIFDKDIRNWIEDEGAYKYIQELSKKETNTNAEEFIQKSIKSQIELALIKRGFRDRDFSIIREEQLLDNKRLDFTVRYGLIGSIMIELKLSHNSAAKPTTHKGKTYHEKLKKYIKGSKSDYGLFVIFNTNDNITKENFLEQIKSLKELYKEYKEVKIIGIN